MSDLESMEDDRQMADEAYRKYTQEELERDFNDFCEAERQEKFQEVVNKLEQLRVVRKLWTIDEILAHLSK